MVFQAVTQFEGNGDYTLGEIGDECTQFRSQTISLLDQLGFSDYLDVLNFNGAEGVIASWQILL